VNDYKGVPYVDHPSRPRQAVERKGAALCLSGGGFRAALFHLGALRRLNELGVLGQIRTISSVSGGSIFAAHLARVTLKLKVWPILPECWREKVSMPFLEFASRDIRTSICFSKYYPWNLVRPGMRWLQQKYREELTGDLMLAALPDHPRFLFCATDLRFGDTWTFSKKEVKSYYGDRHYEHGTADFPVAQAVAASSCFPPVFGPMRLAIGPSDKPDEAYVRLSDGGVRDNMGVDPVWDDHEYVIVSDGGTPFRFDENALIFPSLRRALDTAQHQSSAVRKRWLVSEFKDRKIRGTYWGIASAGDAYKIEPYTYSRRLAETVLARIRTDLDHFTSAECEILENHGYLLADVASQKYLKNLIVKEAELNIPHSEWFPPACTEKDICDALRSSYSMLSPRRLASRLRSAH
jgi:NTE family protein